MVWDCSEISEPGEEGDGATPFSHWPYSLPSSQPRRHYQSAVAIELDFMLAVRSKLFNMATCTGTIRSPAPLLKQGRGG
jgi:hypothetical protein